MGAWAAGCRLITREEPAGEKKQTQRRAEARAGERPGLPALPALDFPIFTFGSSLFELEFLSLKHKRVLPVIVAKLDRIL